MSAFGVKRTWNAAGSRSSPPLLTQSGHEPGRNPAVQRSPDVRLCYRLNCTKKKKPRGGGALNSQGLQFNRKLGCGAYTKYPDIHPKRGRRVSSSMSALRRRERALRIRGLVDSSSGGRSLPPLQTAYQLPSRQQCRRLRRHSLQPQFEVYTSDTECL
jgi:hypothetical protein